MKPIFAVLTIALSACMLCVCGCNSVAKSRTTVKETVSASGDVKTVTTTEAYGRSALIPLTPPVATTSITNSYAKGSAAQNNEGTKQKFNAMRPYHYLAIVCLLLAASIVWLKWTKTIYALYLVGGAVGLSAWAIYLPANESKVFYGLIGLAVCGALYIAWRHGKD